MTLGKNQSFRRPSENRLGSAFSPETPSHKGGELIIPITLETGQGQNYE